MKSSGFSLSGGAPGHRPVPDVNDLLECQAAAYDQIALRPGIGSSARRSVTVEGHGVLSRRTPTAGKLCVSLMDEVAKLLNELLRDGVITDYALFGAAAEMRYTEPVAILDVDVLVVVPSPDRIDLLTPIYTFRAGKEYQPEGEAVQVGAWPVQFIPAFDALTSPASSRCSKRGASPWRGRVARGAARPRGRLEALRAQVPG